MLRRLVVEPRLERILIEANQRAVDDDLAKVAELVPVAHDKHVIGQPKGTVLLARLGIASHPRE